MAQSDNHCLNIKKGNCWKKDLVEWRLICLFATAIMIQLLANKDQQIQNIIVVWIFYIKHTFLDIY